MKKCFFSDAFHALTETHPQHKCEYVLILWENLKNHVYDFNHSFTFKEPLFPSYHSFCTIVHPQKVLRRRNLSTPDKLAVFLHAILHIEYNAIDLALDHCCSFQQLPDNFYYDWIEVAKEEVEHFYLIQGLLATLGFHYGDFPVHNSLFEAARKTPSLIERMALIPRFHEAGGLDANKRMKDKIKDLDNPIIPQLIQALNIILNDEIEHVKKGDRWFKFACQNQGINSPEDYYFELLEQLIPRYTFKTEPNIQARRKAGFSCQEIKRLYHHSLPCD